jgi:hypothetical protein
MEAPVKKRKENKIIDKLPDDCVEVSTYGNHELRPHEYFYSKEKDLFYHVSKGEIMRLHVSLDRKSRYVSMSLKNKKKNIKVFYSIFLKK